MKGQEVLEELRLLGFDFYEPDPLCSDDFFTMHAVTEVRSAVREGVEVPSHLIVWANQHQEFGAWMTRRHPFRLWPDLVYEALGTEKPRPRPTLDLGGQPSSRRRGRGWDY